MVESCRLYDDHGANMIAGFMQQPTCVSEVALVLCGSQGVIYIYIIVSDGLFLSSLNQPAC